jgi:hypothetical protein
LNVKIKLFNYKELCIFPKIICKDPVQVFPKSQSILPTNEIIYLSLSFDSEKIVKQKAL